MYVRGLPFSIKGICNSIQCMKGPLLFFDFSYTLSRTRVHTLIEYNPLKFS